GVAAGTRGAIAGNASGGATCGAIARRAAPAAVAAGARAGPTAALALGAVAGLATAVRLRTGQRALLPADVASAIATTAVATTRDLSAALKVVAPPIAAVI